MKTQRLVIPPGYASSVGTILRLLAVATDQWRRDADLECTRPALDEAVEGWAVALDRAASALEHADPPAEALRDLAVAHGHLGRELAGAALIASRGAMM